jgi:hypothetical protein
VKTTKEAAEAIAVCRMIRSVTTPCAFDSSTVSTRRRARSHRDRRRGGRPGRALPTSSSAKAKIRRRRGDVDQRAAQQFRVASQPAEVEASADFEHQQAERRIGNRPRLGQRLDADPAEQ